MQLRTRDYQECQPTPTVMNCPGFILINFLRFDVSSGSFTTGSSRQQARPCRLSPDCDRVLLAATMCQSTRSLRSRVPSPSHAVEYFWREPRNPHPNAPSAFALDSREDTK